MKEFLELTAVLLVFLIARVVLYRPKRVEFELRRRVR